MVRHPDASLLRGMPPLGAVVSLAAPHGCDDSMRSTAAGHTKNAPSTAATSTHDVKTKKTRRRRLNRNALRRKLTMLENMATTTLEIVAKIRHDAELGAGDPDQAGARERPKRGARTRGCRAGRSVRAKREGGGASGEPEAGGSWRKIGGGLARAAEDRKKLMPMGLYPGKTSRNIPQLRN